VTADVPPPARWTAEILADQQQFTRVGPDGLEFPGAREVVTLTLTAPELLIGRRHERRGIEPAIDLSGPLGDPAASHRHAVLTRLDDGAYAVTDLGSTNGTDLNDGRVTIEPGRSYRLGNGDRIHIGAWTTIIVRQSS
jgi:pSer/pThr/pTyr-binding forkhead associated (FHA) protein